MGNQWLWTEVAKQCYNSYDKVDVLNTINELLRLISSTFLYIKYVAKKTLCNILRKSAGEEAAQKNLPRAATLVNPPLCVLLNIKLIK
jgi:hypothetical protein